jgi:hypothetical protein
MREQFTSLSDLEKQIALRAPTRTRWVSAGFRRQSIDNLEDDEPWLKAKVGYQRMVIPLVGNPRAETSLQKLVAATDKRLAALEYRRLHRLNAEDLPGGMNRGMSTILFRQHRRIKESGRFRWPQRMPSEARAAPAVVVVSSGSHILVSRALSPSRKIALSKVTTVKRKGPNLASWPEAHVPYPLGLVGGMVAIGRTFAERAARVGGSRSTAQAGATRRNASAQRPGRRPGGQ